MGSPQIQRWSGRTPTSSLQAQTYHVFLTKSPSTPAMTPLPGTVNYPGVRQIARVRRHRQRLGPSVDGAASVETAYLITSLDAQAAPPTDLLALNRGHWAVENGNHRVRDTTLGEDACLARTGNGPLNRASLNNIALAVVFANRRDGESLAAAFRRFQLSAGDAVRAVCGPPPANPG